MDTASVIFFTFFGVSVAIVLFVILRSFVWWYWGISKRIDNQEGIGKLLRRQNELLEEILRANGGDLSKSASANNPVKKDHNESDRGQVTNNEESKQTPNSVTLEKGSN